MFLTIAFVPREDQDGFQTTECTLKTLGRVVQRLWMGQSERVLAVAKGTPLGEHFALKGGLLYIAWGAGDSLLFQQPANGRSSTPNHAAVHMETVPPEGMNVVGRTAGGSDAW